MTTSTTPDPLLAAYQSGDFQTANNLISQSGMSPQDVISKYNLNADQASQVASNLGYTGGFSGDKFGSGFGTTPTPAVTGNMANVDTYNQQTTDVNGNPITTAQGTGGISNLPTTSNLTSDQITSWAASHPNATASDISSALKSSGANPAAMILAGQILSKNAKDTSLLPAFNQATGQNVQANLFTAPNTSMNTNEFQNYAKQIMNDPTLTQFQKENQISQAASVNKIPLSSLNSIYGAANVNAGIADYGNQMKTFINNSITSNANDGMAQASSIVNEAKQFGLNVPAIASATGMKPADVQSIFDNYQTGLSNLATAINAPTTTNAQKAAIALQAQNAYGIPDSDFATALNMKPSQVTNFLQPVRDFGSQLTGIASNLTPGNSAQTVQDLITEGQKNPLISGVYGAALDQLQTEIPKLQASDAVTQAQSGTNVLQNYQQLLDIAQKDPTVASALGPSTISGIQTALQESGGGKYISTFEALTGLDKSLTSQATSQLPTTTVQVPITDQDGNATGQTTTQTQIDTKNLPKGVTAVQDDSGNVTYQQQIQTPAGWDTNTKLYATYDSSGNLTGYYSPNPVFPTDANGNMSKVKYDASWTASGQPTPTLDTSHGGQLSNFVQNMGPLGGLAISAGIAALTGGLGGTLTDAIGGALSDAGVGVVNDVGVNAIAQGAGKAITNGIFTGGLSGLLGGSPAKGFDLGALSSGITQGLNAYLPSSAANFTQPVGNAVASSAVYNTPLQQNLINAIKTGGINTLLNNVPGVNKNTATIAANLLPNIIAGKGINPLSLVTMAPNLAKAIS